MYSPNNHLLCAEAWNPTAEEYRQLEGIQNTAIRNILDTDNKTPIAAWQIQSGLPTIKEKSTKYKLTTMRRRSEPTTQSS